MELLIEIGWVLWVILECMVIGMEYGITTLDGYQITS